MSQWNVDPTPGGTRALLNSWQGIYDDENSNCLQLYNLALILLLSIA